MSLINLDRGIYNLQPDLAARYRKPADNVQAADGLSIGFKTVQARVDPKTRIRKLHQIDLWEISIVTFPLLPGARVRAVKEARPSLARPARARKPVVPEPSARRRVLYQRGM